jgi:hypothetical protein
MNLSSPSRCRFCGAALVAVLLNWVTPALGQMPAPAVSSSHLIHLGGYASAVVGSDAGSGPDSVRLTGAAASLLVSGTLRGRLSYFSEVEAASRSTQNWTGREDDRGIDLVRLYAEYAFSDKLRLRVGRFLTPVGQWNEIHADPLTWTAERPLTTYYPFSKSTTGIMAAGQLVVVGRDVGYAIYYAPTDWGADRGQENSFVWAAGGRVAVELIPGLTLGVSGVALRVSHPYGGDEPEGPGAGPGPPPVENGREEDRSGRPLIGADASWSIGRLDLLSEAIYVSGADDGMATSGAFLQGAFRVVGRLYAVARSEYYEPVLYRSVRIQTLGLTLRPNRHWTLKLDRQIVDHPSPRIGSGWFASVSALF